MRTSSLASAVLVAGLASTALGQPGGTPGGGGQPGQTPPAPVAQPVPPPAPQGLPVPNLPIIETKELEGGLLIEEMKIGDGYEVKPGDTVVAFYHGTLKSDDTKFDSAFERGEPTPFSLNGVVEGWQKGVPGMKVGGIRKLTIPYAMAYGEAGRPPQIPAKADLVFVIQLEDALHWSDVTPGTGEEVHGQAVAVAAQKITTKDGQVTTNDANNPYIWIPGETRWSQRDDAMQSALMGMKVGGKRTIHIPKQMNPAIPEITDRPTGVAMDVELELKAVRNLQPKPHVVPPMPPANGAGGQAQPK